jgi:hypothetical protein
MLRLFTIVLATLACCHLASAASFAIRCFNPNDESTYFVTFHPDANKVVFKSAGGNVLEGHVTSSEAGRIAFTLSYVRPPDFDLVWDEASAILTWIAIPNNPERGGATSPCTIIPPPDK